MTPESESRKNLRDVFRAVVKSDIREWKNIREIAGAKGVVIRDFEHAATKDRVQVIETVKFDPIDEMVVTRMKVTGTHKGKDVSGILLIKPEID